jgi:putative flippase GtrA
MTNAATQQFFRLPEKVRYLLVGGYNTVVGYGLFLVLQTWLGSDLHYLVVLTLAFFLSVGHSFAMLKLFVFRTIGNWRREYLRANISYLLLFAINAALLSGFVDGLHTEPRLAQLYCTVIVAALGYVIHKKFSFLVA